MKIWKLNMLRIYPVELIELSCVGGVYTTVGCRDPVYNSAAHLTGAENLETDGSRLTTGPFTPPTRRNSTSLSANCSDSSRLVETVANYLRIQYTPPTRLNSTVESRRRRRRRCVLGFRSRPTEIQPWGLGSASSPSGVWGGAPAEIKFGGAFKP